jgi:tetratricopeptide (TPR) repeat protein
MQEASPDPLSRVRFIALPEGLSPVIGGFALDPATRLPVELPPGKEGLDLASLTVEMLLAGMLKVLAFAPHHDDAPYYRKFVEALRPDIFGQLMATGVEKARERDYALAAEIFKSLAGLKPESAAPLVNEAIMLEDRATQCERIDKTQEAEALLELAFERYKAALALSEPESEAFYHAGFFFLRRHNLEKARECLERFVDRAQDYLSSLAGQAGDQRPDTESLESLLDTAREALSRIESRGAIDALFKSAYDDIVMGREEAGIAKALDFVTANPGVWNAWFLIGWGNRRLGRYDEAIQAFSRAESSGGDEVDLFNEMSICHIEKGEYSKARKYLEKALSLEPENVKIISNLGVLAMKMGRADEARGFFLAALEIEAEDPVALRYLAELDQ